MGIKNKILYVVLLSLLSWGFVLHGVEAKDTKPDCLTGLAASQIGVREAHPNDSYEIRGYLWAVGFNQPVPWCAAFVGWTHALCGIESPLSAWSPAWFPAANTIYTRGRADNTTPRPGDVFGLYYQSRKRIAHVGFIESWPAGDWCITIEGNTNGEGSREGDGVYRKRRLKRGIYKVSRWT
jgi:hypothetical protein